MDRLIVRLRSSEINCLRDRGCSQVWDLRSPFWALSNCWSTCAFEKDLKGRNRASLIGWYAVQKTFELQKIHEDSSTTPRSGHPKNCSPATSLSWGRSLKAADQEILQRDLEVRTIERTVICKRSWQSRQGRRKWEIPALSAPGCQGNHGSARLMNSNKGSLMMVMKNNLGWIRIVVWMSPQTARVMQSRELQNHRSDTCHWCFVAKVLAPVSNASSCCFNSAKKDWNNRWQLATSRVFALKLHRGNFPFL